MDDPGADDVDPDEWRDFFGQFGHVTFVTVAKDNGPLITALAKRRAIMREIIMIIGNGRPSDEADSSSILDTVWDDDGKSFAEKLDSFIEYENNPNGKDSIEKTRDFISKLGFFGMKRLSKWREELASVNVDVQLSLDNASEVGFKASKVGLLTPSTSPN